MGSERAIVEAATTMKVLSNPARLEILRAASVAEVGVSHLAEQVGLPQPATSQHLRALREVGLVTVRVDGNHRYYRTSNERLSGLTDFLHGLWAKDLTALKAAAEKRHAEDKRRQGGRRGR